jgi:hypothetical protein
MNLIKRGSDFWFGWAAAFQSIYYILTGLWSHVHISSFIWITGPKTDIWLVKTVGILLVVIGIALLIARFREHYTLEIVIIAIGTAIGLTIIEIYYVMVRRISPIYLLDSIIELILVGIWIRGLIEPHLNKKQFNPDQRI